MTVQRQVRQAVIVFGTAVLVLVLGTGVSLLGIALSGGVIEWRQWLADHSGAFRIWRCVLYAVALAYWIHLRRSHPLLPPLHQRLLRLEYTVIGLLLLLELQALGGLS
ncbi:hypothetical protein [Pseudomonas fluorescens]|uniref:hypothetical protein n=1 Tax=Pseudomonas fluorescens TaxID=294 RepID=UPI001BE70D83|nr:hypothetical protein [Pseudomonas fluorescens]MBT2375350.1 hypothetical protein [Pseudomonas fluorescens]